MGTFSLCLGEKYNFWKWREGQKIPHFGQIFTPEDEIEKSHSPQT